MFRSVVSKQEWETVIKPQRVPLGAVKMRGARAETYTRALPNAPDGEYVVIQYDTQFENKDGAVETVVPMLREDGQWRVAGYFIR